MAKLLVTLVCCSVAGMLTAARASLFAQTPQPPLLVDSLVGADLYQAYCAACHGRTGRGDGPVAPALTRRPTDLTLLAKRAGGRYPLERVLASIDGKAMPSPAFHGTTEMPIWGPIFRQLDVNDARTAVRVQNLAKYVESLQER